jgi:hypothetical protein
MGQFIAVGQELKLRCRFGATQTAGLSASHFRERAAHSNGHRPISLLVGASIQCAALGLCPTAVGARIMELIFIGFVGTGLLMAAELGDFVERRRPTSVTVEASSAVSRLFARSRAAKSWAADYADFYDEAA